MADADLVKCGHGASTNDEFPSTGLLVSSSWFPLGKYFLISTINLKPTVLWGKFIICRGSMAAIYQICVRHLPKQTALSSLHSNRRNGLQIKERDDWKRPRRELKVGNFRSSTWGSYSRLCELKYLL